jgi:medium-chain acyl-[acyl-carrier-protein] hydrolase
MLQSGPARAAAARTKWLVFPRPNPTAAQRLVCFASAGHGPSMYRSWAPLASPEIDLAIVQLPGRESRWSEPSYDRMTELVPALAEAIEPHLDCPFAFFGHSLGALVAFELTRRLRARLGLMPRHLFLSAHRAPQLPNPYPRIASLPDREFVVEVNARHGGVPEVVASNKELMDLMLPSLKADYRLFEGYEYVAQAPLACPISAFGGVADAYVKQQHLEPWREQTSASFTLRTMEGGHFFVNDLRPTVVSMVMDDLKQTGL